MIALLGSYMEILAKLDKDEQIKYITKAMLLIRKESTLYQDKHITATTTLSKLCKIKWRILAGDRNISHIYPIFEVESEDELK